MPNTLHITNGDGAANILKSSDLTGDVLPWRDTMHYGPFPNEPDLDKISTIRAGYFGGESDEARRAVERDFQLRNAHLRACNRYDEIVLWFEHDLLDQLQILQLLDWFGTNLNKGKQLTLICINQFSGIEPFRGIGELNREQMASLFEYRQPITDEQITLAQQGWQAFRSPTPADLEAFISSADLTPLPFLKKALTRHLLEFPHAHDGLTQTERQILGLVANGVTEPHAIFSANMALETVFFIGDWATYRIIGELCNRQNPLLHCEPEEQFQHPPVVNIPHDQFIKQKLNTTANADSILSGKLNYTEFIARDFWLGGVNINSNHSLWMWDNNHQRITQAAV